MAAYDFTHGKLREVAYDSLSAARRRLLHRRIAQALEAVHARSLDTVCGEVATQYELAGCYDEAIPYYQRAAQAAQRVYANGDAIRYDRRALALLEGPAAVEPGLAAALVEHLGDVLHFTGQYEEARDGFQRATNYIGAAEWSARARLQVKIGNTWREQYRYADAMQHYAEAEHILEQAPCEQSAAWWQAWIQIALEKNLVYYWLGSVQESDELRRRLQPAIEQHGSAEQRAVYFQTLARIEFRRNQNVATAETVALARASLAAHVEAGNLAGIPAAQFRVGLHLVLSGRPQEAQEPLQAALYQAEQTGDMSLQARCLTYLTVACRQCGQVEEVRRYAGRGLEVATVAHMPEYQGSAKANQAWLAWLAGDLAQTQELAQAALALWRQLPPDHASATLQWQALWPLIAAALHEEQISRAMDAVQMLLAPSQQRLPDTLAAILEQAVQSWNGGAPAAASALLREALVQAQQMHYL